MLFFGIVLEDKIHIEGYPSEPLIQETTCHILGLSSFDPIGAGDPSKTIGHEY
jgi:hypothetical protein